MIPTTPDSVTVILACLAITALIVLFLFPLLCYRPLQMKLFARRLAGMENPVLIHELELEDYQIVERNQTQESLLEAT